MTQIAVCLPQRVHLGSVVFTAALVEGGSAAANDPDYLLDHSCADSTQSDEEAATLRVGSELMNGNGIHSLDTAMLLAKLQQSQTERAAWEHQAKHLALMLDAERRLSAREDSGSEDDEPPSAPQPRADTRRQQGPQQAASNAFRWPGDQAERVAALAAKGDACGWLMAPDEVELGARLGAGAFGETFRGRWRGADVAVKRVQVCDAVELSTFLREVECLSSLRHPGIVPFVGAALEGDAGCLIATEYCPNGTLAARLAKARTGGGGAMWPLSERLQAGLEVATALAALEACRPAILHRDVKPSNVLFDAAGRARLSDFGLSRRKPGGEVGHLTGETGTYIYMAPEVVRHEAYDARADVWSFGVMLAELVTTQIPYGARFFTPAQVALAVSSGKLRPSLPAYYPAELSSLVEACCEYDPAARPTLSDVITRLEAAAQAARQRESEPSGGILRRAGLIARRASFSARSAQLAGVRFASKGPQSADDVLLEAPEAEQAAALTRSPPARCSHPPVGRSKSCPESRGGFRRSGLLKWFQQPSDDE